MLIFSIIIYTLFGGMCIWFIISGVQKIKQIRIEQAAEAESHTKEDEQTTSEEKPEAAKATDATDASAEADSSN